MTKQAVWETYQSFLDQMADETLDIVEEELGGGLVGRAVRTGAKSAMKRVEGEMQTQGRIVVEYAATVADDADDREAHERRFLETNPVYRRYDGDRQDILKTDIIHHFRDVGDDLAPLVAAEQDDFWLALRDEYSRSQAEDIVERHFSQAETFEEYKEGVFSSQTLADNVITVMDEAERRLRADIFERLDRVYDA